MFLYSSVGIHCHGEGKMALVWPGIAINKAFLGKKGLGVTFSKDISGLVLSWVDRLGKTCQIFHLFLIDYVPIIKFLIYLVQALKMVFESALS